MAIKEFIQRVCVQDAVYWEYTGVDEFGSSTFKDPTEIKVRWDDSTEIQTTSNGKEFISMAEVLTPQDLTEQSYLYLGTLASLPADPEPLDTDKAYEIKAMDRHPLFAGTSNVVFIAYLDNGSS